MYVRNPKNHHRIFLDESKTVYEDRLEEIKAKVLSNNDIVDYCRNNAIIENNRQELSHVTAERILENCATYLLLGQFKKNDIMTIYSIRKAQVTEIPSSSLNNNVEDMLYSSSFGNDDKISIDASSKLEYYEDVRDEKLLNNTEINMRNKRVQKRINKYKDSKAYRLEMLHSTKPVHTYKIKQQFYIDEDGKRKPIKNVFGQPVFDAEYMTIGGRDGIIDEQNLYKTVWKIVDINNEFWYNTHRFKIDKDFEPYRVRDNKNDMDKILIVPIKDNLVFYDQNINKIPDGVINMMN